MTTGKKITIWVVWILAWPTLLYYFYSIFQPTIDGKYFDVISFAILMCIVAFFPIVVGETPIFFIQGISFAVFLYFGLFIEIVLTQIALIALIMKIRTSKDELHRIPANLTMFLLISIMGASMYYLLGGQHGVDPFSHPYQFLPIISYALGIITSNQILLYLLRIYMNNKKERFFSKGLLWEFVTSFVVLPVGFILYLLYMELGAKAIYFVGVPFIMISIIIKNYYSSDKVNSHLKKTSEIGQKLAGQLNVKEVLDIFTQEVSSLLDVKYTYIYDVSNHQKTLSLIRFVDTSRYLHLSDITLNKGEGVSGKVYDQGYGVSFQSKKNWEHIQDLSIPEDGESILSVPVRRNDETVGILTIVSTNKRAYEKSHFMLLGILSNYLAVAMENARHYEQTKTKSEQCHLTKLYNYRYFTNYLQTIFEDMRAKGIEHNVSLILLDVDHFKKVNDMYGHESGNEVLIELAQRLKDYVGDDGVLARYGGEEFVIVYKDKNKVEAFYEAKQIHKLISRSPITLRNHIEYQSQPIKINITASVGVASFPEDCEDLQQLVRHADRAMYFGAKRKGRNRVATYEHVSEAAE
ncbi:sensor domain-containing diguanylate cyclase [Salirhabdus salicampi]|uniref:sensor domain-containing diguanylate cyclase n=1 Tax=Salirhabdus salicampi TaxID=476102 RepID=UPI0020C319D4|nr:sensor domain-containing diguanylate cyclase [Salirhabdus salicampi]MCP8617017.1 sensor domain-containing diguanylate cyclase [Salirhabdus salicampi]